MRQRSMAQLHPVSIPEIVRDMAGSDPVRRIESDIAGDDEGPCLGIELTIWERMKVNKLLYVYRQYAHYMHYLHYIYSSEMFPQVRRHIVHTMVGGGGQHEGYATLDYRKIHQRNAGKLGNYPILSYCLTNLLGFCLNITHIALRASIFRNCPQTEVTLMCTEHFLMIRYKPSVILCALPSPVLI
jgi:hypothetical protein